MAETIAFEIPLFDDFYLSRIRREDKAAYLEHFRDQEISRNTLRIPYPYTEADADQWLDRCEKEACDPEKLFAIRDRNGYLVGSIGIADPLPQGATSAEIGYWLAKSYRGCGLMGRAISTFAEHAFQRLGLIRLHADTFVNNFASQRALEKAGFARETFLPRHHLKNGAYLDAVRYGKFRKLAANS